MLRQPFLCLGLSVAALGLASAQNFKLGIDYSELVPAGPSSDAYQLTATADSQGDVYILYGPPSASVLTKVSAAGDRIFYQTPLAFGANVTNIAADPAGNVYISTSTFVEKLASDGKTLVYRTVVGNDSDPNQCSGDRLCIAAMAVDTSGRVYLTGTVPSGGLMTTPGVFQPTSPSNPHLYENFVIRLKTNGAVDYATYLGDSAQIGGPAGIAADAQGSAFVTGLALADFPTTPGAYIPASAISTIEGVPFVARLTADGSKLVYATLTGTEVAYPEGFAVDPSGDATVLAAGYGKFKLVRLNPQGTALLFSSSLPVSSTPLGFGSLAVDAAGNTYLLLTVGSNYVVKNSLTTCSNDGIFNAALAVLDNSGNILQTTYFAAHTIFPGANAAMYIVGFTSASYVPTTQVLASSNGDGVFLTRLSPNPNAPVVKLACVSNAAFYYSGGGVAPGELVSLFGQGLGPATGTQPQRERQAPYPKQLAGVEVTFNGTPGPLMYVQDSQINAIAPWSLQSGQTVEICVVYNGASTNCIKDPVVDANPGVFTDPNGIAYAWNQDGTINSPSHPAPVGSIVSVLATGLGSITPAQPDGTFIELPLPSNNVPVGMSALTLCLGGFGGCGSSAVAVLYAGPAPFEVAGVSQINFVVSPGALYLSAGAGTCSFGVYVAQQP